MVKPEKKAKVQKFLEGKLKFEPDLGGKHESFFIPKKLAIHLPKQLPVNLQHGRGDVTPHIIRQIFNLLGLEYREFVVGKDCNISASVIYRALLWRHLQVFVNEYSSNRVAIGAILEQYLISSEASLKIILADFELKSLNKHEIKVAKRISDQASRLPDVLNDYEQLFDGRLSLFVADIVNSFDERELKFIGA